ncbi:MAG: sensor domain-containing diguanylate cyclase [Rhizobiaceae bacterium]|nr:sensor domain-containing diguanylate cyclase [Rhizobiaceae bacterium]
MLFDPDDNVLASGQNAIPQTALSTIRLQLLTAEACQQWLAVQEIDAGGSVPEVAASEFDAFFNNPVVGMYRSTPGGRLLRSNPALVSLHGYRSEQEFVAAINDIATEWYVDPMRRDAFCRLMKEHGKVTDFVSEIYRHGTRERIWITETAWIVPDVLGRPACYAGTVAEITARREAEALLEHHADHDPLTDLANRRLLKRRLDRALSTLDPGEGIVAVLCLDLDGFKPVNDRYGHAAGDAILVEVARRLASTSRASDLVARVGGDEFTVLISRADHGDDAVVAARRFRRAVSEPYDIGDETVTIGVSIGIAFAPLHGFDARQLLENADIALYRAKRAGRNHLRIFDSERQPPSSCVGRSELPPLSASRLEWR